MTNYALRSDTVRLFPLCDVVEFLRKVPTFLFLPRDA